LLTAALGAAVALTLGIYGRVHDPSQELVFTLFFSSTIAMKVWLATVALAFAVVQVGDGLGVLAREVGEEALDVVASVGALLGGTEGANEGLQERFQPGQDTFEQARGDLGVVQQFVQAGTIAPLHDLLLDVLGGLEEILYANDLRPIRPEDTVEL
jgi:hypothetical protein